MSAGVLWCLFNYDGDDNYDNDDSKCKVEILTDFIISGTNMCHIQFLGNIALSTANLQAFIIQRNKIFRVYSVRVFSFFN